MSPTATAGPTELAGALADLPLDRLLRFLVGGGRFGRLSVTGPDPIELDLGDGVVAVAGDGPADADELVGALLRSVLVGQGDFAYRPGDGPPEGSGWPATPLLDALSGRLDRWRTLSEVLPSLDVVVRLCPVEADAPAVAMSVAAWNVAVHLDGSRSVRTLAGTLGGDAFATIELVHDLVQRGLAEVLPPPPPR